MYRSRCSRRKSVYEDLVCWAGGSEGSILVSEAGWYICFDWGVQLIRLEFFGRGGGLLLPWTG